jgi:hypothetical protein
LEPTATAAPTTAAEPAAAPTRTPYLPEAHTPPARHGQANAGVLGATSITLRFRLAAPQTLMLRIRGPLPSCHVLLTRKVAAGRGANRLHVTATRYARPLPAGRYLIRLSRPHEVVLERILALSRRSARPRLLPVEQTSAPGLCPPTAGAGATGPVVVTTDDAAVQGAGQAPPTDPAPVTKATASSATKTSAHDDAAAGRASAAGQPEAPFARGRDWGLVVFVLACLAAVGALLTAPEAGHRYRIWRYHRARNR